MPGASIAALGLRAERQGRHNGKRKRSTADSPFNPRAKSSTRKVSTAIPAIEPGSTAMLAQPVAVLPLACGRLEPGPIRREEEQEEQKKQKMQKIARCNEKGAHRKGKG